MSSDLKAGDVVCFPSSTLIPMTVVRRYTSSLGITENVVDLAYKDCDVNFHVLKAINIDAVQRYDPTNGLV